ncbi:MAG TPA: tol-pal system protein YbgF [Terriglobia bacterium]|nr:tol-pal system protein YbgF [Terriglobia bacterium]
MMGNFFSAAQAVMARSAKPSCDRQFSGRGPLGEARPSGPSLLFNWRFLPAVGVALIATACLTPLSADEIDDLRAQVQQMQQQLQAMQGGAGSGPAAAQQVVQMQQLQQQLASMQGEIEQVQIKVNDLSDKLDRAQKDNEFRLSALEQAQQNGGAGAAAPGAAPAPSAAPPAAPSSAAPSPAPSGVNSAAPAGDQAGQPHVLGSLNADQPLPQAPAGAAEAAAAAAGGGSAGNVVLPGDTPKDQYEYAVGLLQKGSYPEAEVALKTFLKDHSSDPLAGNAQYWLGETYYARQDYKNAAVAFAEGYQKYPNSPKVVDNLLKLGMALGQSGQKDNACVALKQLDKKFPDASGTIKDRAARAKQRFGCPA